MKYISTRGNTAGIFSAEAIKMGMVPAGGLFVPEQVPYISDEKLKAMVGMDYKAIAKEVLQLFLTDYTNQEIDECINGAYNAGNFPEEAFAPLEKVGGYYIMELWHGPTAAFKDMALQIMPYFLSKAIAKSGSDKEIVILVATSGDTGKAALEGFKNVPGIKIITFYPDGGVSKVQELQMNTTDGDNTFVVAVRGNFDDCQNAVKEIFADASFGEYLAEKGFELSSANSINWGRLLPQIIYYFWAYLDLAGRKEIEYGDKINFVVPTGNFGNILAAYYASQMGVPINKLICASNENKVLTDFFETGVYNRNREFIRTNSPSMDILISSNLERFLFEISGHNGEKISLWQNQLAKEGAFKVDEETFAKMQDVLAAGFGDQAETLDTIKKIYEEEGYTLDTHTAVAVKVYEDYVQKTGDKSVTVIDSTASPYKFNQAVVEAIKGQAFIEGKDEIQILDILSDISGTEIHQGLRGLDQKPVKHDRVIDKDEILETVEVILGLK